jgi:hypothetical protein
MNANHLLFWASALGSGSWHQFKCAVERLSLEDRQQEEKDDQESFPLYQQARFNLQRLGHVEFNPQEADWQVVPPVFAIAQQGQQARAVLCGARSEHLLARVRESGSGLSLLETPCDACPDIICLEDRASAKIEKTAERLGILVQPNAPEAILVSLPPVESLAHWPRSELPFGEGWKKERFCVQTLSWQGGTDAPGTTGEPELLRFTRFGRPFYFVHIGTSGIQVPGQMGKFLVLRSIRRRVMFYDRQSAELSVRPICRPPLFVERALCLCSGFPASFDQDRKLLVYMDIPEHVAQLASRALRQEIL